MRMPSFGGYMLYSGAILIPVFLVVTFLFFYPEGMGVAMYSRGPLLSGRAAAGVHGAGPSRAGRARQGCGGGGGRAVRARIGEALIRTAWHDFRRTSSFSARDASIRSQSRARVRETASTATVDGDNGLGLVVGPWANELAMEKAEKAAPAGWPCATRTTTASRYYPLRALERDMIGWSMTNSRAGSPPRGAERMLGTNPIAIAFPGGEEPPIVVDMATSAVAYGKIEIAQRRGKPIPEGLAIDARAAPPPIPRP